MAFTRTWNDNRPAGSVLASLIDDEMQYVRKDVRECIDVEHTFPATDDSGTGLHRQGSGRIFVDVDAQKDVNLTAAPTGYRVGRMQWSGDTQLMHLRSEDGTTIEILAKKRFKITSFPMLLADLALINSKYALSDVAIAQNTSGAFFGVGGGAPQLMSTHIPFTALPGAATGSKLQVRLVIHGSSNYVSAAVTIVARTKSSYPVDIADPILCTAAFPADTSQHCTVGSWTDVTLLTDAYVALNHIGTTGQTFYLLRCELQFRINE